MYQQLYMFCGEIDEKEILELEKDGKILIDNKNEIIFIKDDSVLNKLEKYTNIDDEECSYELYKPMNLIDFIYEHNYSLEVKIGKYTTIDVEIRSVDENIVINNIKEIYNYSYNSIWEIINKSIKDEIKDRLKKALESIEEI